MLRLFVALVIVCLGAAAVGAVVPGLFWLTLVALAGLLVAGAAGVSTMRPPAEGGASPARLNVGTVARGARHRVASQDGGELRRAA